MGIFRYDNPLMTGIRRITDYIILGMLWMLASLPVITFGAATTAMLQTAEISIYREEGKLFVPFWKRFGKEFKQATLLWLIQLPMLVVLVFNIFLVYQAQGQPILQSMVLLVSVIVFCWMQLWFCYQSRFEDSIKTLLRNTFHLALGNPGWAILLSAVTVIGVAAGCAALYFVSYIMFLIPGIYIILYTAVLRKLMEKIAPEESADQDR